MWSAIFIGVLFALIIACIVVLCSIKPETAETERRRKKIVTGKTDEIQKVIPGTTLDISVQQNRRGALNPVRTDTVMMPATTNGRHTN